MSYVFLFGPRHLYISKAWGSFSCKERRGLFSMDVAQVGKIELQSLGPFRSLGLPIDI